MVAEMVQKSSSRRLLFSSVALGMCAVLYCALGGQKMRSQDDPVDRYPANTLRWSTLVVKLAKPPLATKVWIVSEWHRYGRRVYEMKTVGDGIWVGDIDYLVEQDELPGKIYVGRTDSAGVWCDIAIHPGEVLDLSDKKLDLEMSTGDDGEAKLDFGDGSAAFFSYDMWIAIDLKNAERTSEIKAVSVVDNNLDFGITRGGTNKPSFHATRISDETWVWRCHVPYEQPNVRGAIQIEYADGSTKKLENQEFRVLSTIQVP